MGEAQTDGPAMAEGNRGGVGGIVGAKGLVEKEKSADHLAHGAFVAAPGPGDGLFHLTRGVFPHGDLAFAQGGIEHAACMGHRHARGEVLGEKEFFNPGAVRATLHKEGAEIPGENGEAAREIEVPGSADHAGFDEATTFGRPLDEGEPGDVDAGIEAEEEAQPSASLLATDWTSSRSSRTPTRLAIFSPVAASTGTVCLGQ